MEYISSKPAPTLPEGFSAEIKDFVSICLRKEGGTRSSASELLVKISIRFRRCYHYINL